MTKNIPRLSAVVVFAAVSFSAHGQVGERVIPGYHCMMLNLTEKQSMDPTVHVYVHSEPRPSAPEIGWAASVVIVRDAPDAINGFDQVLFPNRRTGWVAADMLKPYHSLADPSARCVPMVLANGRVGFGSPPQE